MGDLVLDGIQARLTLDPARDRGEMHFTFADTAASVYRDEIKLGEIVGCVGGGIELRHEASGRTWYISARVLWDAFIRALTSPAPGPAAEGEGEGDDVST